MRGPAHPSSNSPDKFVERAIQHQPTPISSSPKPRCCHMGELSKPLLLHPRGSAFILHQAHFYLPRQLYPAGCPHGHRRIWRGGIGILSHQLWNHGSLPAKQAFDKYLTCYFIFRAGEDSHLFVGSATSGCLHLFMDVCYPDDWHIRGATERDSFL